MNTVQARADAIEEVSLNSLPIKGGVFCWFETDANG